MLTLLFCTYYCYIIISVHFLDLVIIIISAQIFQLCKHYQFAKACFSYFFLHFNGLHLHFLVHLPTHPIFWTICLSFCLFVSSPVPKLSNNQINLTPIHNYCILKHFCIILMLGFSFIPLFKLFLNLCFSKYATYISKMFHECLFLQILIFRDKLS